jgi:hypothetical protein
MELNRDLEIYQGDDFAHTVTVYDTEGELFQFGNEHSFSARICEAGETSLSVPGDEVIGTTDFICTKNNGIPGIVNLSIDADVTKDAIPGRHWFELKMITDPGGGSPDIVLTLFSGLAIIHPETTKITGEE